MVVNLKRKPKQQVDLIQLLISAFTSKNSFVFIANCSLEDCIANIEKEHQKSAYEYKPTWWRSELPTITAVEVQRYPPTTAEFAIRNMRAGKYGFNIRFSGLLEMQNDTSTYVQAVCSQTMFTMRMFQSAFLMLLGLVNGNILVGLAPILFALYWGPILTLQIKARQVKYIKSIVEGNEKR